LLINSNETVTDVPAKLGYTIAERRTPVV
jgi:hypothetical protein